MQSVPTEAEFNSLAASVKTIADRVTALEGRVTKLETTTPTPTPTSTMKLYAPMFMWVGPAWDALTALKQKYPAVDIIACFNPSNGDFTARDTNLGNGLAKWKAAGIKIIGFLK